jgi:branched-chain amino acid transport system permease protein
MRFIFKTDYAQDIHLAKHGGHIFWYSLLMVVLVAAPWLFAEYWLAQLTFILIYSIAALGIMLLAGFTGLFSLGHAAFLGVGAYTQAVLTNAGIPFPLALACAAGFSAAVGWIVGLPALRLKGIYLGMATLSFGFIVEEVLARWESVTGGNAGINVKAPDLFGWVLASEEQFYFLCLALTVLSTFGILNLLRSPTGLMIVIGGLGSVHGAFLGAIFLITAPQMISLVKDYLPAVVGQAPGLQGLVYGAVLIGFVLFEPMGLYGRWLKIRTYIEMFPFYRKGMFKRQKSFQKSDRLK